MQAFKKQITMEKTDIQIVGTEVAAEKISCHKVESRKQEEMIQICSDDISGTSQNRW